MASAIDTVYFRESQNFVYISDAEFHSSENLNIKLQQAAKMGFFYMQIPESCKPFIADGIEFTHSFYSDAEIKDLRLEGFSGYNDRKTFQVESLYLERAYWKAPLPTNVQYLAKEMHRLGVEILNRTLNAFDITEDQRSKLTGEAAEGGGDIYFTSNHYDEHKPFPGMEEHKDFGQITVLFINQLGLQAHIERQWVDVKPVNGYFIINFGRALEHSVNQPSALTAAWHRVQKVAEDRISFGVFIDNKKQTSIYQRSLQGELQDTGVSFDTYITQSFAEKFKDQ